MSATQPSSIRLIAAMGLAGFASGMILVGAYLGTLPRIRHNQAEALKRAVFNVLPGTTSFQTYVLQQGRLEPFAGKAGELPQGEAVYRGTDAGGHGTGFAIVGNGPGFMDNIKLLFGYLPNKKTIVGMEVLESRETPGLGDKIIFDEHFLANFKALEVEPEIVPVKKGAKTQANQVDTISGATISAKAVVKILNQGVQKWMPVLPASGEAPAPDRQP